MKYQGESSIIDRDFYWDTIKGFLMIVVVIGHFIEFGTRTTFDVALHNFIYTFHMPLFVFLSGYFFSIKTKRKLMDKTFGILMTYLVFQVIYYRDISIFLGGGIVTSPFNHLWYIFSLAFWRIFIFFLPKERQKTSIVLSIIVALLIGFIPFPLDTFSISRTFVFFPYFLLGFYLKGNNLIDKLRKHHNATIGWVTLLSVLLLFLYLENDYSHYFWGNAQYQNAKDLVIRLIVYIVAITVSSCILVVISENKLIAKIGRASLHIYLWHWLFMQLYLKLNINIFIIDWMAAIFTIALLYYTSRYDIFHLFNDPYGALIKQKKE